MKKKIANRLEWVFLILFLIGFVALLSSCRAKTVYIPLETVKTEYKDRLQRDSIHLLDSVFVDRSKSGDTIFITKEKYKYLYKDKLVRDTITLYEVKEIPFPIVETKEVNKLKNLSKALKIYQMLRLYKIELKNSLKAILNRHCTMRQRMR